jgi:tagaturonate reductase
VSDSLPRLSRRTLTQMSGRGTAGVALPPSRLLHAPERVLQFGFGRFVRGFLADFLQAGFVEGHFHGRMLAVQRRADRRMQSFRAQDGLYTLVLRGHVNGEAIEAKRILGSVSRILDAETMWAEVMKAAESPDIKIITTNVSEGGLALNHQDQLQSTPALGLPGKLTQVLFHRWQALPQSAEIGLIPCELVDNNGELLRSLLVEQASRWELENPFVSWLQHSLHVTSTVVDRIVAGAPDDQQLSQEWDALGYRDELLNCAEPFYEFILQSDAFIQRHFPVDRACSNVRFVDDVRPYRARKLLILNGSHTTLAALGRLLGIATVLDAVRDQQLGPLIEAVMTKEIVPAADLPADLGAEAYARTVLDRFSNPFVRHELRVICSNASIKVGTRLFPTVRRYMQAFHRVPPYVAAGIAGVLLALRDPELEDVHADYIRERWRQVKREQPQTLYDFTREVLCKQMEWTGEWVDVEPVAAAVSQIMVEIEVKGVRRFLAEILRR